jgi:uncharacterized membrane protein YdjX (TVP38/TMEM64 family)
LAQLQQLLPIISQNPSELAAYLRSFGALGPLISTALMILATVIPPLPAIVITFANGMIWGWFWGAVLTEFSALACAALGFGIARRFGRPLVQKMLGKGNLEIADAFFERYGGRTVLIARLLPFISYDLISYGAGLTDMRFRDYMWATATGQLPGVVVYTYLASVGGAATSGTTILIMLALVVALMVVASLFRKPFIARLKKGTPRDDTFEEKEGECVHD